MNEARRRTVWHWVASALLLTACSGIGMPSSLSLSEAELQAQLARRFPLQRSLLDAVDLRLSEPKLRLDAQANRLTTELTLVASERRSGRRVQGRLGLNYALRYEASDGSIRLVQPRVESFEFDGAPGVSARRADATQGVIIAMAEQLLDDLVLYRVPSERLDMLRAMGLRPGTLRVTPTGLEITIEPLPPAGPAAPSK